VSALEHVGAALRVAAEKAGRPALLAQIRAHRGARRRASSILAPTCRPRVGRRVQGLAAGRSCIDCAACGSSRDPSAARSI